MDLLKEVTRINALILKGMAFYSILTNHIRHVDYRPIRAILLK